MITRQDSRQVYEAFTKAKVLYMSQHPWEIFNQDQWDGSDWKQVVQLTQQQTWEAVKHYIEWMEETYLREHMQTLIQLASLRLYHTLWGEHIEPSERVKKGEARFRRKPRLVDKITEGVALGLSGPSPSFAKMGAFLAEQAFKGIQSRQTANYLSC